MLHIILSFPFAYFFIQVFLDIGKMGLLNFMSLFIILGIGADDIFIFVDAWKQSAIVKPRAKYGDGDAGDHDWLTARLDYSCVPGYQCLTTAASCGQVDLYLAVGFQLTIDSNHSWVCPSCNSKVRDACGITCHPRYY
jgi:hypothetical protein